MKRKCDSFDCPYRIQIEGYKSRIEHIMDIIESTIVPTQAIHSKTLERHEEAVRAIEALSGIWIVIQRIGVVIAAAASVATFVMKLRGL